MERLKTECVHNIHIVQDFIHCERICLVCYFIAQERKKKSGIGMQVDSEKGERVREFVMLLLLCMCMNQDK